MWWRTLSSHPSFNYQEVFDFMQPQSLYYLFLFFYIVAPSFDSPMFQRISMAIVYLFLGLILVWVAILVLSTSPNLIPKDITKPILFNYSYIGLKGITLAGIMAMVMSTAVTTLPSYVYKIFVTH